MLISAGSLNKKITVYKRVVTTLKGKSSVSYTKYKDLWCDWRQINSRELMRNQIEVSLSIYTLRIRIDKTISTADQVRTTDRAYNITSVVHNEADQSTILTVEAGTTVNE